MIRPAELNAPGIYIMVGAFRSVLLEVDEANVVYQLKPLTLEKDGILVDDRWTALSSTFKIHGPFKLINDPS